MFKPVAAAFLIVAAAGCSDGGDQGTSIAITGDNGQVQGAVDAGAGAGAGAGAVKIDTPLFKGELTLPKLQLDAGDFNLNGVSLYPGSTISGINLAATEGGGMRISFSSPANPATVRDWFADRLAQAGFRLQTREGGLTGTTQDNKPFRLDLLPSGDGQRASGTITIQG